MSFWRFILKELMATNAAIPIIIEEVKNEKTDIQLGFYSIVLKRHFEKDLVINILEYYKTISKGIQKDNIDKLLARLRKS